MVKGKYLNFIASNVRYSKYQIVVVAVLFVLSSLLINTFLFLSLDYSDSYADERARLNGEDVDLLLIDTYPLNDRSDEIRAALEDSAEISRFEVDAVVANNGTVEYKDGKLTHKMTYMRLSDAEKKNVGKYEILESSGESGVYLGYVFKADGGYELGDEITVTLGTDSNTFKIAGFYNNVDTGSMNCTDVTFLLTDDCYEQVEAYNAHSYRVSIVLNEPENAELLESELISKVCDAVPTLMLLRSSTAIRLSNARYITATMFRSIITVTSVLMIAVVLAVIAITLSNYIRNNMKNLGTLKALGYRSDALIIPIVLEFAVIAVITSVIGVALSYLIFPTLNTALERQVGIPYQVKFMPLDAVISVAICTVAAAVVSLISVKKIRRITPIMAIREARSSKNAGRTFFPLEKCRLGLNTAISLKTWISAKTRNLVIFLSLMGISFLLGFSCFIYQNIVMDSSAALELVYGNVADSIVSVSDENKDALFAELDGNEAVERYYLFTTTPLTPDGLPKLYAYIYDDVTMLDGDVCIDGRMPESDGEIAVNGAYASKNGLSIGDTLAFSDGNEETDFTVIGLVQGASSTGYDCYLTYDGCTRLMPVTVLSYYVDLKSGEDIDGFNRELDAVCKLLYYANYREMTETVSASYKVVLAFATVIVVAVSLMIAAFILYILLSVYLANKKRDHGILKSLGFVTKDIIYQTVVSIMPTGIIATVIGLWLSRSGAAQLLIIALRGIGVFSFGSPTKIWLLVIAGTVTILFTAGYSMILSNSVRKITPHQLFNNE